MGKTIGILGGGQLGLMIARAAKSLGAQSLLLSPDGEAQARKEYPFICASYDDEQSLEELIRKSDVITFEFEHIPQKTLDFLEKRKNVIMRPTPSAIRMAQHRIREKSFLRELGITAAPWAAIEDEESLRHAIANLSFPLIFKTAEMGYDGLGQKEVKNEQEAYKAYEDMPKPLVAESFVDFKAEYSMIGARDREGGIVFYPLTLNEHQGGVLLRSVTPMIVEETLEQEAQNIVRRMMEALDMVGLLAVEFFLTRDGSLAVNECAPRPHNSGHWTLEGARPSQFEQLVRVVLGKKVQEIETYAHVEMVNILGDVRHKLPPRHLITNDSHEFLYGKKMSFARPKRKLGHINYVAPFFPPVKKEVRAKTS